MTLNIWRSLLQLLFACDNLWKSIVYGSGKSLENSEFFSPTLWSPCKV